VLDAVENTAGGAQRVAFAFQPVAEPAKALQPLAHFVGMAHAKIMRGLCACASELVSCAVITAMVEVEDSDGGGAAACAPISNDGVLLSVKPPVRFRQPLQLLDQPTNALRRDARRLAERPVEALVFSPENHHA
jgi:hypothetical protein